MNRRNVKRLSIICASGILLGGTNAASAQTRDIVETAVSAGSFKTLAAALEAADLVDALKSKGPFTVFAPTDDAFARLPEGTLAQLLKPQNKSELVSILMYHAIDRPLLAKDVTGLQSVQTLNGQRVDFAVGNGRVTIDKATVIQTDIQCTNGVIHVIDAVLLPEREDIAARARSAGMFNTLLQAVQAAGLADALSSPGPFTVLAPTDEAFAQLPPGTLESLLQPRNREQLAAVLKYHVVSGRTFADQAIVAGSADTLQGQPLRFGIQDGRLRVNDAVVLANDLQASNGVIHVIDKVLMPPAKAAMPALNTQQLIELAIARGAPLFNEGQPQACAAVYEVVCQSLLASADNHLTAKDTATLRAALAKFQNESDARSRAWILRHALDDVYMSLASR